MAKKPLALYVHVPFCIKKCPYCAFYKTTFKQNLDVEPYIDALCKEVRFYRSYAGDYELKTLYFGGGTPSLLSPSSIERIIKEIIAVFGRMPAEASIELNPSYLTKPKLRAWEQHGFNRVSVGVQAFQNHHLAFLGRDHTKEHILASLEAVSGFESVNIDLIYALKNQSLSDLVESLSLVKSFSISHLSAYALTIEPDTPFKRKGTVLANEKTMLKQWELICSFLEAEGFDHYAMGAFAKVNKRCVHNMFYWWRKDYIGLGPGAHSWFMGKRFKNRRSLQHYLNSSKPKMPKRACSKKESLKDFLLARTRLFDPIAYEQLLCLMTQHQFIAFKKMLCSLSAMNYVQCDDSCFSFTRQGRLLLDELLFNLWDSIEAV